MPYVNWERLPEARDQARLSDSGGSRAAAGQRAGGNGPGARTPSQYGVWVLILSTTGTRDESLVSLMECSGCASILKSCIRRIGLTWTLLEFEASTSRN